MKHWWYSLLVAVVYVATFWYWKVAPSRAGFLVSGLVASLLLAAALAIAARRNYFTDTADRNVHLLVLIDLLLETFSYEAFRWYAALGASTNAADEFSQLLAFHDNYRFFGCATAFAFVIGGYRWLRLRRMQARAFDVARPANAS